MALSGIVNSMKELRDITVQIFLLFNLVAMDDSREEFDLDDLVPDDFHVLFLDEEFHPYTREDLQIYESEVEISDCETCASSQSDKTDSVTDTSENIQLEGDHFVENAENNKTEEREE